MALGDNKQFIEALAHFSTTSSTYVLKTGATFVTPLLPAGDYVVGHTGTWQNEVAAGKAQIRILINAITVFETEELVENEPDNAETDSHLGFNAEGRFSIAVPTVLTISTQVKRVGGVATDEVSLDDVVLFIYQLDVATFFYNEISGAGLLTGLTTYQLAFSTAVLTLAAGNYRIYVSGFARNEQTNTKMGIWFRERKDPTGVNTITDLYGDDRTPGVNEAFWNNTGRGVSAGDPYQEFSWVTTCRVLTADDYQYEVLIRAGTGAGGDVEIQNLRIFVEELP